MIVRRLDNPPVAVVIGLVSTVDRDRILETLAFLHEAQGDHCCEIVLADRRKDAVSAEIRRRYPQVQIIDCPANTTLPVMRTLAFDATSAPIVAVTEDHCVPAAGWLAEIEAAFFEGGADVAAVGGTVVNGVTDTSFDWANFICEYGVFSPPVPEGPSALIPGMNVAYRRAELEAVDRHRLTEGFWETTVHPLLLEQGKKLLSRNGMKLFHCKRFSKGLFYNQRWVYSRYYAGLRFPKSALPKRMIASAASLILPPILLLRLFQAAMRKGMAGKMARALPTLCGLVLVWAGGEIWGYVFGPGDALAQLE
jgi:hypothetical protein